MGGFYGSTHLRMSDREAVRAILEEIARDRRSRFLLGPELNGWLSVYPNNGGQGDDVARALARRLPCDILHVYVHDDDIFGYTFFRAGKSADQYSSRPDYFGRVSVKIRAKLRGKPDVFDHLVSDENARSELRQLLSLPADQQPAFASESLVRFARLLGLPNAVTSYEYLNQGETEEIEHWDEFIHVPDRGPEIAAQRAAEARLQAEKQRLRDEGLLLWEQTSADKTPLWCPDREGAGFLVAWIDLINGKDSTFPIEHLTAPWSAIEPTSFNATGNERVLKLSPSGRYLAIGGFYRTHVWDLVSRSKVMEVPCVRMVSGIQFTSDERHLVTIAPEEILITFVRSGRQAAAYSLPHVTQVALHPSGKMAATDHAGRLILADLLSGAVRQSWYLGGATPRVEETAFIAQLRQAAAREIDVDSTIRNFLAEQEAELEITVKHLPTDISDETRAAIIERIRLEKEREFERVRNELEGGKPPAAEILPIALERAFALESSRDGRGLFCATSAGVRVFSWDKLLGERGEMPPDSSAGSEQLDAAGERFIAANYTYTLAHDETSGRLLFAGSDGCVRCLNLASGESHILLELPGHPSICGLTLSRDGSSLCCVNRPGRELNDNSLQLQIWNYAKLRDLAGARSVRQS